jgi:putative sigma-54 modulation protein
MRIEIRGRNVEITDELRRLVALGMKPVDPQVPRESRLEVVLREEQNPAIGDRFVAEANLRIKGATLHAHEATPEMSRTVHALVEDIRRQVRKHVEKRRNRSKVRRVAAEMSQRPAAR